jgi:hypothetical protein
MQPAKGCQTKNETAKMKKCYKLARGIMEKWAKKQALGVFRRIRHLAF